MIRRCPTILAAAPAVLFSPLTPRHGSPEHTSSFHTQKPARLVPASGIPAANVNALLPPPQFMPSSQPDGEPLSPRPTRPIRKHPQPTVDPDGRERLQPVLSSLPSLKTTIRSLRSRCLLRSPKGRATTTLDINSAFPVQPPDLCLEAPAAGSTSRPSRSSPLPPGKPARRHQRAHRSPTILSRCRCSSGRHWRASASVRRTPRPRPAAGVLIDRLLQPAAQSVAAGLLKRLPAAPPGRHDMGSTSRQGPGRRGETRRGSANRRHPSPRLRSRSG